MTGETEVRARDVRVGDRWHNLRCEEEFIVTATEGADTLALIWLENGIDSPMRFPRQCWVLVHRGEQ